MADLYSIAIQCPYAGGPAVYEARSMYSLINDTIEFDDSTACFLQGIYKMQQPDKKIIKTVSATIVPNPAAENATVIYTLHTESTSCSMIITDIEGKELITYSLPCDKKEFAFSTAKLANGMYLFQVIANDSIVGNGKFTVSK